MHGLGTAFPLRSKEGFFKTVEFNALRSATKYRAYFERWRSDEKVWELLRSASISTMPVRLPLYNGCHKPLTIALGSCYWPQHDGNRVATAYRGLYKYGIDENGMDESPDLTFLTGDQVYLDIGFDLSSLLSGKVGRRIARTYARHWDGLGGVLRRGATYMLPDDHEWYNGYPEAPNPVNPYLWAIQGGARREEWIRTACEGVENVQRCPVVEVMDFPDDLSICFADLRSFRKRKGGKLMRTEDFNRLLTWANGLRTPGVLVSTQPLVVTENKNEVNLLEYTKDYCRLLAALGRTGHDIVVMSGDVHYGPLLSHKF